MKNLLWKIAIYWGVASGVIWAIFSRLPLTNFKTNFIVSLIWFLLYIIFVFLAFRGYKKCNNGLMKFENGLLIGTIISCISVLIDSLFTIFFLKYIDVDYFKDVIKSKNKKLLNTSINSDSASLNLTFEFSPTSIHDIISLSLLYNIIFIFLISLVMSFFMKKEISLFDQ